MDLIHEDNLIAKTFFGLKINVKQEKRDRRNMTKALVHFSKKMKKKYF